MVEISEKNLAFAAIGVSVMGIAIAFMQASHLGLLSTVILAIGGIGAAISYGLFQAGYIIMPMITSRLGVKEIMAEGYVIPPSQNVVLRNVGGIFYATKFLSAKFYEAATVGEEETTTAYMDLWERAMENIKFPMKFNLICYPEDIVKYRERIETERARAQLRLGKEKEKERPDPLAIDKWEREIAMLNEKLARLTAGERPMGVLMYVSTTGVGVSEKAAIAAAERQANEIRSTVANALNLEISPIDGEDMKKCFKWEFFIPPEPKKFLEVVG